MMYLMSLGAGLLVGLVYGLLKVRSPAPPAIALVGLLGMLLGEQLLPVAKRMAEGLPLTGSWLAGTCWPRISGSPPTAEGGGPDEAASGRDEN